jgi:hypothetical protein
VSNRAVDSDVPVSVGLQPQCMGAGQLAYQYWLHRKDDLQAELSTTAKQAVARAGNGTAAATGEGRWLGRLCRDVGLHYKLPWNTSLTISRRLCVLLPDCWTKPTGAVSRSV